jgi:alpha-L-fucosidase
MLPLASLLVLTLPAAPCSPQQSEPAPILAEWAADRDTRMAWWREARFGMFVHFGLYSAAGGTWDGKVYPQHYAEWIQHWAAVPCAEYAGQMKPLFQPALGFADAWAELAADAGMRYAVMTSKHHDGFTLFNSKQAYSLGNEVADGTNISPAGRDVAREFADAMRARGLRPGFYYSLLDWQHPDAYEMALPDYPKSTRTREHGAYKAYMRGHVEELLTGYGELATIWFDYSDPTRQGEAWGASDLLALLRAKQPKILVNNRLYFGLENKLGDYGTPEKYVPPTGLPGMDWEVNHTLNESYGFSAHDANWKDTGAVVRLLCDVVSKGGNLLLNIGPDAEGRVPAEAQRALHGVGAWMKVNGEAIYGTQASPFARLPWGRATRKGNTLYLMVFDWPSDDRLRVPVQGEVKSISLLGAPDALFALEDSSPTTGLALALPGEPVDKACSVLRLEFADEPRALPFAVVPAGDGTLALLPHDATLTGPSLRVEQVGAIEDVRYNLGYWLDASAFAAWPVAIETAGSYRVLAELACKDDSAGSRMSLECGASRLEFEVPATGAWQQYRELELGALALPTGRSELALRALTKSGEAVVNVRALRLVPR